jgi:hypothetical protein
LEQTLEQLKKDPTKPVRAEVGNLTVEVRAVTGRTGEKAADVFASLGPWAGESTEELLALLADARRKGGRRPVPAL